MIKTCLECKKDSVTQLNRKYCSDFCAGMARKRKIKEASSRYQKRILLASKGFDDGVT
jgi:hypothetical protein